MSMFVSTYRYAHKDHTFRLLPVNGSGGTPLLHAGVSLSSPVSTQSFSDTGTIDFGTVGNEAPPHKLPRQAFEKPMDSTKLSNRLGKENDVSVFVYGWQPSKPLFLGDTQDRAGWVLRQRIAPSDLKSEYFSVLEVSK